MTLSIAVLVSGTGSNLGAIFGSIDAGRCDARVHKVISDRPEAAALGLARQRGIATEVVRLKDFDTRAHWDAALLESVATPAPDLVVLAGFMRLVGPEMIARFASRIINVHPSLLPLFPGTDAPAQAIAARVRVSGCSVHVVDRGVDTGAIIAQAAVSVLPDDDAERLHRRIAAAEHRLLPAVIDGIARGGIELGAEVRIDPASFSHDGILFSPALLPA
jgi:phosphoribosylglycinamide formyltransferase 1